MISALKNFINHNLKAIWLFALILLFLLLKQVHELAGAILLTTAIAFDLTYSLLKSYLYRKGKLNYIVFPTYNDGYSQFHAFFFSIAILAGLCFFFYQEYVTAIWFSVGCLVVLLLFVNGLYSMPAGFLKVRKNTIEVYGIANKMKIEDLSSIDVHENKIVIKNLNGKVWLSSNLKIDSSVAEDIEGHLSLKLVGSPVKITCQVVNHQSKIVI